MQLKMSRFGRFFLSALSVSYMWVTAWAAPAPEVTEETFTDRAAFLPKQKHQPQPKTVIGVLASDVAAVMGHEGRGGPPDAFGFGMNGNSYRWVYVAGGDNAIISGLQVKTGEKGDAIKTYPKLDMANPQTIKHFGFSEPYSLVEIEVNDGLGAPAEETFVATKMTRLDDTKDYPLKVAEVITTLRKQHGGWLKDQQTVLDDAMSKSQAKAVKDAKPTGPRQTNTVMFVTWMAETQKLQVRFLTRISDGVFEEVQGGGNPILPPKGGARLPPPPPQKFRTGTEFGIEFGVAYEVSKSGNIERILKLPTESFENKILAPPAQGGRAPLDPLPPKPIEKK